MSLTAATLLLLCAGPIFEAPVKHAVAADIVVLLADLNRDGLPEILTSGNSTVQSTAFSLLRNYGDGTFAPEEFMASEVGEKLEDFNGFLVASIYWRNGISIAGTFHETATHGGPTRIADYDRDGIDDVISFSFGSANQVRVHLFRGRGDGTFEPKKTFDTRFDVAANPSMRVRDGAIEFVAGDHSGRLNLFRITADGVETSFLPAGPDWDLAAIFADVNGDGVADVIDANGSGGIFVTLAKADGGFHERTQLAIQMEFPDVLKAGDFDRDGRLDLIAGDFHGPTLYWLRGDGTGAFEAAVPIDAGGPVNDLAVGDVNRDGRPDLVAVNDDQTVAVIVNRERCPSPRRRAVRR